jgi:UDP-3-O-[3-hydroxymyristoyl] glucosamine N-acyltransferase
MVMRQDEHAVNISLGALADALSAQLHGDAQMRVHAVATLADASAGDISFLANRRYRRFLDGTSASAVILSAEYAQDCPVAALVTDNPYLGYARAAALLNPSKPVVGGVHPTASVAAGATVEVDVWIDAAVVIEDGARIGTRTSIGPGCVIGRDVVVGNDCHLVANVTLCRGVCLGERVLLHPGVVIGGDGFGIANDGRVWVKVPQLGAVEIGDDVEIGANSTVDRGALRNTLIGRGVKIDNLVQIGHNVEIGEHTAIAACVAIGGSAKIGRRCTIGGAASLAGHLEIADDVHLTATSAVPNSIGVAGVYSSGMPVQENRAWRRNVVRLRHLDDMARQLKSLHAAVARLSGSD